MGAGYYRLKSTDSILLTTSGSLYSSFSGGKATQISQAHTNQNFNINPAISILNKRFAKINFIELGTAIYSNYSYYKNPEGGINESTKSNQHYYTAAINTGIGKSRLENVKDLYGNFI